MFTCNMRSIDCNCVSNNPYKNNIDTRANEAPKKLYFGESDKGVLDIYSNREPNDEIEYTRIDAFIEKAERYIRSVADGLDRDDDVEAFISGFRKYMKGE